MGPHLYFLFPQKMKEQFHIDIGNPPLYLSKTQELIFYTNTPGIKPIIYKITLKFNKVKK